MIAVNRMRTGLLGTNKTLRLVYILSFVFGFTALAHENNLAATASLIAGNSINQYAIIIGLTLGGMAVGFKISGSVGRRAMTEGFLLSEIALTAIAGFSVVIALWSYANTEGFIWVVRGLAFFISTLVGIEDALILRIVEEEEGDLQTSSSKTFWFSNLGGAMAGFTFGSVLVPHLGVFNLAIALGIVDGLLVLIALIHFQKRVRFAKYMFGALLLIVLGLSLTLVSGKTVERALTQSLYNDPIANEWTSAYGHKVLTCDRKQNCKLFINGQLQFSTKDEKQYHELLVNPGLSLAKQRVVNRPLKVLVAGGGDGFAARNLLRDTQVGNVTIVDLDPQMTGNIAVTAPVVTFNEGSMLSSRVTVVNSDAYTWLRDVNEDVYDLIIVDLVDPDSEATAKLYSLEFYEMINNKSLTRGGIVVTQSTSPWYSAKAFWTINITMSRVFDQVTPYRWAVPSFGDWGWQLASNVPFDAETIQIDEENTDWLTTQGWNASQFFGKDELSTREELLAKNVVSTVMAPAVLHYYHEAGAWDDWGE